MKYHFNYKSNRFAKNKIKNRTTTFSSGIMVIEDKCTKAIGANRNEENPMMYVL